MMDVLWKGRDKQEYRRSARWSAVHQRVSPPRKISVKRVHEQHSCLRTNEKSTDVLHEEDTGVHPSIRDISLPPEGAVDAKEHSVLYSLRTELLGDVLRDATRNVAGQYSDASIAKATKTVMALPMTPTAARPVSPPITPITMATFTATIPTQVRITVTDPQASS